jgi:hypothetical protein
MIRPLFASTALLALAACGPPLATKDDVSTVLAQAAIPSPSAQGAYLSLLAAGATSLPQPTLTVYGRHGGRAEIDFNVVAAALGLIGQGLAFEVHYADYSDDGFVRLGGDLGVLAAFDFQPAVADGYTDLKLTVLGKASVSGVYYDEVHARVTLTTRLYDLQFAGESIRLHLDGYVETHDQRFDWDDEDITVLWQRFASAQGS